MNVSRKRGNTDAGAVFPLPGELLVAKRVAWSTRLRVRVDPAMFFAVCDFAVLYRAALCAARVEVSAATCGSVGGSGA
jgi:hypothetical protein